MFVCSINVASMNAVILSFLNVDQKHTVPEKTNNTNLMKL